MKRIDCLIFGAELLIFDAVLISMLEDPIQRLIMIIYTIWIIIGIIILAIAQSRNKETLRANNGKDL